MVAEPTTVTTGSNPGAGAYRLTLAAGVAIIGSTWLLIPTLLRALLESAR